MVIMIKIGQSAGLLSKSAKRGKPLLNPNRGCAGGTARLGYERVSTTERVSVDNDSLTNLNLLKIQSDLIGNFGESSGDEINHVLSFKQVAADIVGY
jgi:hypothetical protein